MLQEHLTNGLDEIIHLATTLTLPLVCQPTLCQYPTQALRKICLALDTVIVTLIINLQSAKWHCQLLRPQCANPTQ